MPKVSLGPWTPDFGPLGNTGVMEAKNVLPHVQGYKPLRMPLSIKSAGSLSGRRISGAFWCQAQAGQPFFFAGTQNDTTNTLARLWHLDESLAAWADRTQVTASYSSSPFWRFALFDRVCIAVGHSTPQRVSISNSVGTNFANLGGTPPTSPEHVATVRDFVVMANISGAADRVQWSALGNPEDWVVSATTQADFQDISSEGEVTALIGGEYGLIFFRHAIYRMSYIGPPAIFQFDKIADVGCFAGAATRLNDNVYFLGEQGFGVIRGGFEAQIISSDSIDQYLKENTLFGIPVVENAFPLMASDPRDRIVAISYMSRAMTEGSADKRTNIIFYDESLDRFSRASLTHQFLFNALVRRIEGGQGFSVSYHHLIAFFDENNNLSVLEGDNMKAMIETGEGQLSETGRTFVNKVIPFVHGTHAPMVQVGVRERQGQTVSFGATVTANTTNGEAPVRAAGRFHRLRIHMSQSASWSLMTGFEVQGRPDGVR